MKYLLAVAGLLFLLPGFSAADIYRCESADGVRYADEPCGDQAEKINVQDNRIGGSFGQNLPEQAEPDPAPEPEPETANNETDTCRFINSTDLRRYLIREQVVKGMTKDHVLRAFGRPPETYPTPQETWVYQTKYYGALYELTYVYFKDGCVADVVYRKP
ncbi:DUF4124 domain-containing protein [Marinobacter confluentis]|uniref:DUF4124 domain-containing protein n=1 Tax=Marinobacter confluentis TaxID=1697557 RepID=A0A4Z1BP53_9GAMM|nr:DUF4124 domain-containing protein [Marinobacter confluentis]TGN38821.1 DUF4124 domain-containing protein [Marinobacter confluentis]